MNVEPLVSTVTNMTDAPSDPDWYGDAVLLSELATLNARIARFITRTLDADAQRGEPVTSSDQTALGRTLVKLGEQLRDRARHPTAVDVPTPRDVDVHRPVHLLAAPGATASRPEGDRPSTREEVSDMAETTTDLVVGVTSTPVVQDRAEIQLSDGMDDGETRDPT